MQLGKLDGMTRGLNEIGALNSSVARVQLTSSAHGRVLSNLTNSKQVSRIVGELISAKLFVAVPLSCLFRRRIFGVYLVILATAPAA